MAFVGDAGGPLLGTVGDYVEVDRECIERGAKPGPVDDWTCSNHRDSCVYEIENERA